MRLRSSAALIALSLYAAPTLAADGAPAAPVKADTSATPAAEPAAKPGVVPRRAAGTSEDVARYSERQAASPEAKKYEGGDTVVIGATTATIVLAIVLLVVLL